ncbi:MAG: VanZ family protein [Clostridia bacterium]|nr:VanZ family protein [Clostridia bacterium]
MTGFAEILKGKNEKSTPEGIDRRGKLSYNINMMKKTVGLYLLRATLILLCVCTVGFIFYNSIQTGEQSAKQSETAVDFVQEVVGAVAPESPIATATGEEREKLHVTVRTMAHFTEFMALGLFATWCYISFTSKKKWLFAPLLFTALTAVADEFLQKFTFGRASEFIDVLADVLGGTTGFFFALVSVWMVRAIWRKYKQKRENRLPCTR